MNKWFKKLFNTQEKTTLTPKYKVVQKQLTVDETQVDIILHLIDGTIVKYNVKSYFTFPFRSFRSIITGESIYENNYDYNNVYIDNKPDYTSIIGLEYDRGWIRYKNEQGQEFKVSLDKIIQHHIGEPYITGKKASVTYTVLEDIE